MKILINEYLEWKATYAIRACVSYKIWLVRFIEVCGDKRLEDYTVNDVIRYHQWLEPRFSSYSTQYAMVVIKNFLQYCKLQNLKCISPVLIRLPRINAKSHRAITEEEYNKLISVIPTNEFIHLRNSIIIRLLWDTGVRISELCDLDITHISSHKTSTVISTKKTNNKRIIVWSSTTHELLLKYLHIRFELYNEKKTTALFVGWNKGHGWSLRLTPRTIQRSIKVYASKINMIEKLSPHCFRHAWAHQRRDQNAPLAFIQKGLGHINPASTFVYEQYNDTDFEKTANNYFVKS